MRNGFLEYFFQEEIGIFNGIRKLYKNVERTQRSFCDGYHILIDMGMGSFTLETN